MQAVLRLLKGDRAGFEAAIGSADLKAEVDEAVHAAEGQR